MNLFDSLQPEEEREIREVKVEKHPELEEIVLIYREKVRTYEYNPFKLDDAYFFFYGCALIAPSNAITNFCLTLNDKLIQEWRESEKVGFYLSALINKSPEEEHLIITKHLTERISYIGYGNRKKIIINGNVGTFTAHSMSNGVIVINGDTQSLTCTKMTGGKVFINGVPRLSQRIQKGEVYHNGKLIVKDGETVRQ